MIKEIKNTFPDNLLRIEYMLGDTCNYKCSYCFPGSNEGQYAWPDVELVKKNLDFLLDHYKQYGKNKFQFYLSGGEPTIWKDLPELLLHLKNKHNIIVNITTNASRSVNWWIKNHSNYDTVEISVHHEFAKTDHILEVADLLYQKDTCLVANVLMDPSSFEKCQSIVNKLLTSKMPFPIIAKSVHFNGITRYTEDQKEYIKNPIKRIPDLDWFNRVNKETVKRKILHVKNSNDELFEVSSNNWFILNGTNKFNGWTCNLGVDYIKIHQEGTISGNCRQLIWGLDTYQNLYDAAFCEKFNPTMQPTICRKDICVCSSEIIINKKKNA